MVHLLHRLYGVDAPVGHDDSTINIVVVIYLFITTRRYASAVYAMALCPPVSVCVCHKSVFYQKG